MNKVLTIVRWGFTIPIFILEGVFKALLEVFICALIIVMAVFTGEYTTIASIVTTLLLVAITLLIKKLRKNKTVKTTEQYNKNIKLGLYLSIANILYFIFILSYYKFI